jgi:hypothetical protein
LPVSKLSSACVALRIAASRGDADGVKHASADIEGRLIAPGHIDDITLAIALCKPQAAKEMADFLRKQDVAEEIARQISFPLKRAPGMRIKALSALVVAGVDPECLRHLMQQIGAPIRDHVAKLRKAHQSNHARMKMFELEPNLEDLLARSWRRSFHNTHCKESVSEKIYRCYPAAGRNFLISAYFTCAALIGSSAVIPLWESNIAVLSLAHISGVAAFGAFVFVINYGLDGT